MDNEKLGGREVGGSNHFSFRIKGKLEERADELIKRIDASPLTELIQKYLDAAEEVRKNKKLSPEDNLKKLIPLLHEIQRIFFLNYPKYYTWNQEKKKPVEDDIIPFVNDEYIDLKKELDFKNLRPTPGKYSILEDTEFKKLGCLYTHNRNIWLSEEYELYLTYCKNVKPISEAEFKKMLETKEIDLTEPEIIHKPSKWDSIPEERNALNPGGKSISEIWPVWLPTLSQESIKNKDLLTQILVCYTIKRALNGDEKAIKKLYNLYEDAAVGLAVNAANKLHATKFIREMKQDASILLKILLGGFRPEYILSELVKDQNQRTIGAIPKWIKSFYLNYLAEYIPRKLGGILKREGAGVNLGLEVMALLNPYTPIQNTFRKGTGKRPWRFNSYSYKPGFRNNLTTWLFGVSEKDSRATLYRLLKDKYLPLVRKAQRERSFAFEDTFDEDRKEEIGFRERTKAIRATDASLSKKPEEIIEELKKYGILQRDAEIFTEWKFGKARQSDIAKARALSRRQIVRICHKVNQVIFPSR